MSEKGRKSSFFFIVKQKIALPSEKILLVYTYLLVYMRKDKILESLLLGKAYRLHH